MEARLLNDYRNRWLAVTAIEEAEQQEAPLILRWQQLNSIVQIAMALGLLTEGSNEEVEVIRYRWNKLKESYIHTL